MINKIKHYWYTYITNEPKRSPFYYKKCEIARRVLERAGVKPNKTYILKGGIYFDASIDAISGDVVFSMSSSSKIPSDIEKTYMVDARNFLHIQSDGDGYRQHFWFFQYKYFHEDDDHSAQFNTEMLMDVIDNMSANVKEVKK